jgi:hypothetical protein
VLLLLLLLFCCVLLLFLCVFACASGSANHNNVALLCHSNNSSYSHTPCNGAFSLPALNTTRQKITHTTRKRVSFVGCALASLATGKGPVTLLADGWAALHGSAAAATAVAQAVS